MGVGALFLLFAFVGVIASKGKRREQESEAEPEKLRAPRYVMHWFAPDELWLEDGSVWIEIEGGWFDKATGGRISSEDRNAAFEREAEARLRAKVAKYRKAAP